MCNCSICDRHDRLKLVLAKLPPEDQEWLEAVMDYLLDIEFDLEYHQCLLNGKLPGSEDMLRKALHEIIAGKQ